MDQSVGINKSDVYIYIYSSRLREARLCSAAVLLHSCSASSQRPFDSDPTTVLLFHRNGTCRPMNALGEPDLAYGLSAGAFIFQL